MLNKDLSNEIISLLSNRNTLLKHLNAHFEAVFDFQNRLLAYQCLSLLLTENLLDFSQQFVAFWILYKSFESDPIEDHPFYPIFQIIIEFKRTKPNYFSPQLLQIISSIFSGSNIDFIGDNDIHTIMGNSFSIPVPVILDAPKVNVNMRDSPLIMNNETNSQCNLLSQNELLITILQSPSFFSDFQLNLERPPPDSLPISPEELSHLSVFSYDVTSFLFDDSFMFQSSENASYFLHKALSSSLEPHEMRNLCSAISMNQSFIKDSKISNQDVISMIEVSPKIAISLLNVLLSARPELFGILSSLVTTPNVVEVVKSLILTQKLASNFLPDFCKNNISTVRSTRDYATASKIVASFSGLLTELITSGIHIDGCLTLDLVSFCIDVRKRNIKEANELSNLLNTD